MAATKRRKTAYIPDPERKASAHFAARITPSLAARLASLAEQYDLPPALVLEVLHDLAAASGRLDAGLYAAMVLAERPGDYEAAVGRPASEEAVGMAKRTSARLARLRRA